MGKYGNVPPVSEVDAQRALLDSLLGLNRNEEGKAVADFKDERLCKAYFYGVCPKEGFTNTKMACGVCSNIHSDEYAEVYNSLKENDEDYFMFDDEVAHEYQIHLNEAERVIKRARNRVEDDGSKLTAEETAAITAMNPDTNPEALELTKKIETISVDIDTASGEGDIDRAQELATELEIVQEKKRVLLRKLEEQKRVAAHKAGADVNKKLRVCDICGSLLSILDSDQRLADHFTGKQHMTFQKIRDVMAEIRARQASKIHSHSGSRARGYSRDRGSRSRDMDGDRGRGRDRDRDRDRGSRGDRDRERNRERDRGAGTGRIEHRDSDRASGTAAAPKKKIDFPYYYSDLDQYGSSHAVSIPATAPDMPVPTGVSAHALEIIYKIMNMHNEGRKLKVHSHRKRSRSPIDGVDDAGVEPNMYDEIIDWVGEEAPPPGGEKNIASSGSKKLAHSKSSNKSRRQ